MRVDEWLVEASEARAAAMLAEVAGMLAAEGLSISSEEMLMLLESNAEALFDTERVEFGKPAISTVVEAVATSSSLCQGSLARDLSELLSFFYSLRSELPADVPDAEIAEALRGCLDSQGAVAQVVSMPTEAVMLYSDDYRQAEEADRNEEYRIVDDAGCTYVFDEREWDYDEYTSGWNGEGWADDWDN